MFFLIFMLIMVGSEFGAYMWHRFGAHTDIIPGIHDTHKIHHTSDLLHEAHEDFFWVILILLSVGAGLVAAWYSDYLFIPVIYVIIAYLLIVMVFIWNWYVHSACHIPNHWLNKYYWFRKDKKMHLQHHVNPQVNYGIASHFSDIIFGTYEYPEEDPTSVFNQMRKNQILETGDFDVIL